MTKHVLRWSFRVAGLAMLASLFSACAPLSQDELDRLAAESRAIRPLAESLARADDGDVMSLDDERFLAEVTTKTLSKKQFLGVLSTHCASAHDGRLQTGEDSFPLATDEIREFQLQALAGTKGPITGYLREALGRTLNSEISKTKRSLTWDARDKFGDKLHRQATVVCTSYGDNGLLQIHYMVAYLTEDQHGQGDAIWAVASDGTFMDMLDRQRQLAVAAANRMMSEDKETVVAYRGHGQKGFLLVSAELSRPAPYGYDFEVQLELANGGGTPLTVRPALSQARSADGRDWPADYEGLVRGADNSCEMVSRNELRIGPGEKCRFRYRTTIQGFDMPNMVLTASVGGVFVKLSPVSEYKTRAGR